MRPKAEPPAFFIDVRKTLRVFRSPAETLRVSADVFPRSGLRAVGPQPDVIAAKPRRSSRSAPKARKEI